MAAKFKPGAQTVEARPLQNGPANITWLRERMAAPAVFGLTLYDLQVVWASPAPCAPNSDSSFGLVSDHQMVNFRAHNSPEVMERHHPLVNR